jgi:hypothetical protein
LNLEDEGERDAALHDVASKLKLSIKPLRKTLSSLLAQEAEPEVDEPETEDATPQLGTARYERAMELLKADSLLSRAAADMKRLGHVGEFAAKKLALICALSPPAPASLSSPQPTHRAPLARTPSGTRRSRCCRQRSSSPLRIRRDARRLIDVVRAIAWLHQHQRERDAQGRILATEADFTEALGLVSESLRRAWQTLTPAEERVLETIKGLPEMQRTRGGFKRRDLKVREVSDRRVKEVLKSLTDTGYLDCDGRQGPQGYTYTLVREAEEISLGISLRPPPDSEESGLDKGDFIGREAFARYRPMPGAAGDEDGYREAGANGRNGHRPIRDTDLQEKPATGRTGGEGCEEKLSANATNGRRLSAEQVEQVKRLVREGMAPHLARAEVLGCVEEELNL